jgi:glutamyl-tRNA synthetase
MSDHTSPVVRFAPSPTGNIHIGNARTALFNWLFALKHHGQFILRYDDTDTERSTEEFAQGIARDLDWLAIRPHRIEHQSDRMEHHDRVFNALVQSGKLYPCYETPEEIERRRKRLMARGKPPIYDRAALNLSDKDVQDLERTGRRPHWRFMLPNFDLDPFETRRTEIHWDDIMRGPQTVDLASMSDPVLVRADGSYTYTLPSVADDIALGVTHVIRGDDHVTNTGAQITIFQALGAEPPQFGHHNLLTGAAGEGLSKRLGSLSLASLREQGYEAMAVASLAVLIGTATAVEACTTMDELLEKFEPSGVSKSAAKFDVHELALLNAHLVHHMDYATVATRLSALGIDSGEPFWNAVRANLTFVKDAAVWQDVIAGRFEPPVFDTGTREFLKVAATCLPEGTADSTTWKRWTQAVKEATGRKGKDLFLPLRQALTGQDHGPEMSAFLPLIPREKTLRRLS